MTHSTMTLADVNVYLAAMRRDHPDHIRCSSWLKLELAKPDQLAVSTQVLSSVIRITTNNRFFHRASSLNEAFVFSNAILNHPNSTIIAPGRKHWEIFEQISKEAALRGAVISDAWFAALAIEHHCTWVTLDGDFARFKGLRRKHPGTSAQGE